jgi:putative ABC transport system permease protein
MARLFETLTQDIGYALRSFRRSPAFTLVALLSLTLGIGATSAIFSVIYGILLNPYPYTRPGEIWAPQIRALDGRGGRGGYSVAEYQRMAALPAFSDVMATSFDNVLLGGEFAPESFQAPLLSGNAFNFLGVPPILGRTIQPSDIRPDGEAEPVVVLSQRLWLRLFDGDAGAIGKTLRLNNRPHTIIGVMPPRFGWYGNQGFWLPLGRTTNPLAPIVRLAPGVSPHSAEEQLHAFHRTLASEDPSSFPPQGFTTRLVNYLDITVASGEMRTSLQLLLGAVAFLLLIACANVANLQLTRGTARSREMAVRLSIGADRRRLMRQLLTESVLLSLVGGAAGILFAAGATKAMVALMPEFYVPNEARVTLNVPVLLVSVAVSIATGILFGLLPALHSSRPDLTGSLKEAGRGVATSAGSTTRNLLVITEVALSVVLLAGAALTVRTFFKLQSVDLGFQPDRVLIVSLPLPPAKYVTLEQRNQFAAQLLERASSLPGVQAATIGNGGMPFGGPQSTYRIEGQPTGERPRLLVNLIGADHLKTLGISLRAGRTLDANEVRRGDRVALVSETAAKLWPAGQNPIGSHITLDALQRAPNPSIVLDTSAPPTFTIVGIVADTRNFGPREQAQAVVLIPYTLLAPTQRSIALRTATNPTQVLNPLREIVRSLDPDQPLSRPITLEEVVGTQVIQPRFTMALFTFFAALGLALAAAGIYSVLSFHVTRRTHEIGVRMALGARPSHVLGLMLTMGGRLVLVGLLVGVPASLAATRLLRSQLFEVTPNDPVTYVAVAVILSAVAFLACYVPARRAAAVDPLVALRHE